MKIIVFTGSPKGEKSVTLQYVRYLEDLFPEIEFVEHHISANIRSIELESARLEEILRDVKDADAVLWAFPLYFGMVHGAYKRFIELVQKREKTDVFEGKPCGILATSIKFFDHFAIEYLIGISEDWGMRVMEVFSAGMNDLIKEKGEEQLKCFFLEFKRKIQSGAQMARMSAPVDHLVNSLEQVDRPEPKTEKTAKLGLLTESGDSHNLDQMTQALQREFSSSEVFDLSEIKILGHCLGCLKCGYENHCVYEGKDEVIDTYRRLQACDVIVLAGTIHDRHLSSRWKTFVDRLFFTTHIPFFVGKPVGFLISGPLRQIPNLRQWMTGIWEVQGMTIAGIVTDESIHALKEVWALANTLESYAQMNYQAPRQFPAIGGHKVFRDAIAGGLKGVFGADHQYYKKNGLYDFPQKSHLLNLKGTALNMAMKLPPVRKKIQENMPDYMIMSFKKK